MEQAQASQSSEVATTGSDAAKRPRPRSNLSPDGPPVLGPRHKLLIEYMTFGCSNPMLLRKIKRPPLIDPDTGVVLKPERHPEPGDQLTIEEAAELVGLKRRTARLLIASPIGSKAMAKAVAALRDGAKVDAMRTIIAIMHDEGQGKAADRKVRLEAADRILGLQDTKAQPAVSVTINNSVGSVNPGYVIRDPRHTPQTIEGEIAESDGD